MCRRVGEARDLRLLRRLVVDAVEDEVDERELALDARRRVVADLDRDAGGLLPQLRDHVRREVDARDTHAALGERHRDPAGADGELERAAACQREEEVDHRCDGHVGRLGVVAIGDLPGEPVLHSGSCRRTLIEMSRVT